MIRLAEPRSYFPEIGRKRWQPFCARRSENVSRGFQLHFRGREIRAMRERLPKCRIGLTSVNGCIHCGIPSTGVNAPESEASGGLTKNAINCACRAEFVDVAMNVPTPMPESTVKIDPARTSPGSAV
jgi:hypothetical protein